jgi:probable rRNA maturation factor
MQGSDRPLGIANRQRKARPRRGDIRALLDHILVGEGEARGVDIAFVGGRTIRRLHRDWMDDDSETDVLSFPAGPPLPGPEGSQQSAGEIIVCIPVCERSASARRVPLHDEVARMLIHGSLHVLGFDHGTARERSRMKPRERRYLAWYRRRGLEVLAER